MPMIFIPIQKESIQGRDYLRECMAKNVVGGKIISLIPLYVYELEEYTAVVLVDNVMLIMGPKGKSVDLIVDSNKEDSSDGNDTTGSGEESSHGTIIEAVFAWEHLPSLVNLQAQASVINLSFFLLHPSKAKNSNITLRYQHAPLSETRGWDAISRSFLG